MARSYDLAELMTNDGEYITDSVRRKINGNFRRLCQLMQSELPSQQQQQLAGSVESIVDGILSRELPGIRDGIIDDLMPVGSVIVTYSSSDPRLSHGSWQQIGGGRYVRAAGGNVAAGDVGGSGSVVLDPSNIPTAGFSMEPGEGGLSVSSEPSADPAPVAIEPEYVALLFYRRIG